MNGNKKIEKIKDNKKRIVVYGSKYSIFTMKVYSGLRFVLGEKDGEDVVQLRIKTQALTEEVEKRAGTHQLPAVLILPENWMIADSTPVFKIVDNYITRDPRLALFPMDDPFTAAMVALVEEYFDEWHARIVIHVRWHYEESSNDAAKGMARERMSDVENPDEAALKFVEDTMKSWGPRACKATGIDSEIQKREGENEMLRVLESFQSHLVDGNRRFFLGDAPSAVDAIILGSLRAHLFVDGYPKRKLAHLKFLRDWSDKNADIWAKEWRENPNLLRERFDPFNLPSFVKLILAEMRDVFKPFVKGNSQAVKTKSKSFVANVYGEDVSYLTRSYVELSREMVKEWIPYSPEIMKVLRDYDLVDLYSPNAANKHGRL